MYWQKVRWIVLVYVFFLGGIALAQVTTGTISGTVTDSTGAVIPGASITVRNVETGITRTAETDAAGRYRLPQLGLGSYEITAGSAGFQTGVRSGVTLTVGREAAVDFTLQVGAVAERITVTGEAPLLQTTNSTVSSLVDERAMRSVPLIGRSFADLTSIQPGVVSDLPIGTTGTFNAGGGRTRRVISGTRPAQSTFLLDGMEITTPSQGMPVSSVLGEQLGVEAIREFTLLQSNFGAQFGRAAGGVVNAVTQSGTNEFHGSVFEFFRNEKLDARDYFLHREFSKAALKRNQFGASLGGPLQKDRTFFFLNYEGVQQAAGDPSVSTRITQETRAGNFTSCPPPQISCDPKKAISTPHPVNPKVLPLLALNNLPNGDYLNAGVGDFFYVTPSRASENYGMARIDYQVSSDDSLFGRYTQDRSRSTALLAQKLPGGYRDFNIGGYVVAGISETHIFSPTVLNTARVSYTRRNDRVFKSFTDLDPENFPLPPSLDPSLELIRGGGLGNFGIPSGSVGPGVGGPAIYVDHIFDVEDSVNLTYGPHTIIMGATFKRYRTNGVSEPFKYGDFTWNTIEDFLDNKTEESRQYVSLDPSGKVGIADTRRGWRQSYGAVYVQDDWRAISNLTLNLGVRWEGIGSPIEVNGKLAVLRDIYKDANLVLLTKDDPFFGMHDSFKGFSPRVGFAWTPWGQKLVFRGGFGGFKDMPLYHIFEISNEAPPYLKTFIINQPRFPFPYEDPSFKPSAAAPSVMNVNLKLPYTMQWTFSLEQQVGQSLVVKANYVATRGIGIWTASNANQPQTIIKDGRHFTPPGAKVPNPNFASFRYIDPRSSQQYHSGQLVVEKRFTQGLRFNGSYTFAKNIDFGGAAGTKGAQNIAGGTSFRTANWYDLAADKALSTLHVKHNFTSSYTYELPFGSGRRWGSQWAGWVNRVLGGWNLSGTTGFRTGLPVVIGGRSRRSGCLLECDQRPDLKPGGNNNPVLDNWTPEKYFEPTNFVLQPAGYFGNVARNTLIRASLTNSNLSFSKDNRIGEGKTLEFKAELFNIFNHPNFGNPSASIFRNNAGDLSPTVGRITSLASSMRRIQLALKLTF